MNGEKKAQLYHSIAFHQRFFPHLICIPMARWPSESLVAKNNASKAVTVRIMPQRRQGAFSGGGVGVTMPC